MKLNDTTRLWIVSAFISVLSGCGGATPPMSSRSSQNTNFSPQTFSVHGSFAPGQNIIPITVNGNLCGPAKSQYPNEICTSVTLCSIFDPSNCQTINNILVDTGSVGLRVFSSLVTVPLSPVANGAAHLAECVQFGDGTSEWGPINYAYVKLGGEPEVAVPIQLVDPSYGTPPALCSTSQSYPDTSPDEAGFNGILGVGLFAQDCGSNCATDTNNQLYYSCEIPASGSPLGADCSGTATVALGAQVQHPVLQIPNDNNGIILTLPSISATGAPSVTGSMMIGIGTQANNTASGVTVFPTDGQGNFSTVFSPFRSGAMAHSFIDSGSSIYFFPAPSSGEAPDCGGPLTGEYCPTALKNFTATVSSPGGSPSEVIAFQIANAQSLLSSGNMAFNNLGGSVDIFSGAYFDWGLPFFYSRSVYVGIEGTSSPLGSGSYWAF